MTSFKEVAAEIMPLVSRLRVPVLIVWGEDDKFQPVRFGERLARDTPGAHLVRLS